MRPEASSAPTITPDSFAVSVITAREPVENNQWISERWQVLGVVPTSAVGLDSGRTLIRSGPEGEQYLWGGFRIRLRKSDADAYYFNLVGQSPSVLVICQRAEDGELHPALVTVDYIDAMSHREAGADVQAVPIPPEVYLWLEQYVLENYAPEEKKPRRKHDDWAKDAG